jgi:amino acid permease
MCFGGCVFYSAFAGDIFAALASAAKLPGLLQKRWLILAIMHAGVLLPLCLLETLSALQYTSFAGVVGILYTVVFVIKRMLDQTYTSTGLFGAQMPAHLQTNLSPYPTLFHISSGSLVLANMACVAFLGHYNGVRYYEELENASPRRYSVGVCVGMALSLLVFTAMMLFGERTFGLASQPLILNNYHKSEDPLATLSRLAIGGSIVFAYPLMFSGLATSLKSLRKQWFADKQSRAVCIASLLAVVTLIACRCGEEDVSIVLGLVGSVLGPGAAFIVPAVMNLGSLKEERIKKGTQAGGMSGKVLLNKLIVVFGIVFGVTGAWITVMDAHSASH